MTDFYREVDSKLSNTLNPGEKIIWTGHCLSRLGQQRKAVRTVQWAWIIAVVLIGIGLITLFSMLVEGDLGKFGFRLLGPGLILAIGLALVNSLESEHVRDSTMYCRRQTVYVLTDQRAIVLRNCRTACPVQSLLWAYADEVRAESVGLDGRGSVQFLSWHPVERRWVHSLQFFMVGDARFAAQRAIEARDAARG